MTPTEKAVIQAARFLCRDFGRITVSHVVSAARRRGGRQWLTRNSKAMEWIRDAARNALAGDAT